MNKELVLLNLTKLIIKKERNSFFQLIKVYERINTLIQSLVLFFFPFLLVGSRSKMTIYFSVFLVLSVAFTLPNRSAF